MLLVPFPKTNSLKQSYSTILLIAVIVLSHVMVDHFKVGDGTLHLPKKESEIFNNVQSQLYRNFLKSQSLHLNEGQRWMSSLDARSEQNRLISRVSLQDPDFNPLSISTEGIDLVSYEHWLQTHYEVEDVTEVSAASLLGIKQSSVELPRWITYMFVHAGFYHLLSNIIFLFFFGALIERQFGGLMPIILFVGSGLVAAPVYLLLSGNNVVPLVGASGGVSGLIAFYAIYNFKRPLRFFYWLLPSEKYFGFVYLFSGSVLFLWLLADLAGYLSSVSYLENIAHAAHLGGFLAGASCALGLLIYKNRGQKRQWWHRHFLPRKLIH